MNGRTTEIEWIDPAKKAPPRKRKYLALLPVQFAFQDRRVLQLHVVRCTHPDEPLVDQDGDVLDWYEDAVCWWAPLPDFMQAPGWREEPST